MRVRFVQKIADSAKKDAEIFAGSEKVATFASAFEKNGCSYEVWKFTIKELKAFCEHDFFRKRKVLEKRFAGLKKMNYLCSPFAPQNANFFNKVL
ncbi:hypothetical protein [Alistipes sp.]|uniref:hypothetical protein n=1 Tax=Alistipes sp. TaxID=1872444 RepID=UPI003AF13925